MIRGYRWVKSGQGVWELEGPPKSRRFHACVSDYFGWFGWYMGFGETLQQGECVSKREAMDAVEKRILERQKGAAI